MSQVTGVFQTLQKSGNRLRIIKLNVVLFPCFMKSSLRRYFGWNRLNIILDKIVYTSKQQVTFSRNFNIIFFHDSHFLFKKV